MLSGPAAAWLQSRREELNARFVLARRRYPSLSADRVQGLLERLLPPLALDEGDAPLLQAVYELVLLHAGRDSFAAQPGLLPLLETAFPALRSVLVQDAARLAPSLSNAVEQMNERGVRFSRALVTLAPHVHSPDTLLDAVAVLAWRLGHARLREAALERLPRMAPRALLAALELGDWPEAAAPLALASLASDGWQSPRERVSARTLQRVAAEPAGVAALEAALRTASAPPTQAWRLVARLGDFSGFGGAFDRPPLLRDGSEPHVLRLACGEERFRLDADGYGHIATRDGEAASDATSPRQGERSGGARVIPLRPRLQRPELAGASSSLLLAGALFFTLADSHRVRVLAPWREPL